MFTTVQGRFRIPFALAGLLLFSALLPTPELAAQERVVEFDPTKTTIQFTLGDILHTVHGTFRLKPGSSIHFDPAAGAASGTLVVDANSGDSGNNKRDRRMKRDILETAKYPDISFIALQIAGGTLSPEGNSQIQVKGTFRLHGTDHQVTIAVPVQINGDQLSAQMHFVIPYVAWGLKNPSTLFLRVSDKVTIDIAALGRLTAATAAR
jgi:polyisoprenoid-binding protein YceI